MQNGNRLDTIRNRIDHNEVPEFDQVTGITFSGSKNYSITHEEESADTYREEDVCFARQDGKNLSLDIDQVRDYLNYIGYLNLTDFATYNAPEKKLSTYGLDTPELTVPPATQWKRTGRSSRIPCKTCGAEKLFASVSTQAPFPLAMLMFLYTYSVDSYFPLFRRGHKVPKQWMGPVGSGLQLPNLIGKW